MRCVILSSNKCCSSTGTWWVIEIQNLKCRAAESPLIFGNRGLQHTGCFDMHILNGEKSIELNTELTLLLSLIPSCLQESN